MIYASVCSGVEATSLAWLPLGWKAAWFSEIEPFPCAVLKERFPDVPNLGDMTKIKVEETGDGQLFHGGDGASVFVPGGVDLLVGGTPCQSFSVAGKREGLEGASGLAEHFVRLLRERRPRWFVWENVPGALSSRTGGQFDFNFLVSEYAKCGYSCGWRVLDAQYVRVDGYPRAVPQRRRRVFVVGHSSADWRYPASVLFEPDCLFGDTPPRRVKGQGFTADAERCAGTASTIRMCCGKPGGGKGALVSDELSLTLAAGASGNNQPVLCYDARGNGDGETANTITGDHPNRVTDYTPVAVALAENTIGRQPQNGGNGTGYTEELAYTQNATGGDGRLQHNKRRKQKWRCRASKNL